MKAMKLVLLSGLLAGTAHAAPNFTLEQRGNNICRLIDGQYSKCMPSLKSLAIYDRDSVEVLDMLRKYDQYLQAKASNPGAQPPSSVNVGNLISEGDLQKTLKGYGDLSVRLMAADPEIAERRDGKIFIPFQASVFWKNGQLGINGTIYVEGTLQIKAAGMDLSDRVREQIRESYMINSFSDGNTEQKKDFLSFVETGARKIHFNMIGTDGQSVDGATMALLDNVVAPMVAGEIISHQFATKGQLVLP